MRSLTDTDIHYVRVDETLCNGCVLCMKVCPTKAIRTKMNDVARIEGICIDCGECVRVCPKGAISAITSKEYNLTDASFSTVSASTVLYAQFDKEITPNDVLLGLRKMGFDYVHDQTYTNEMYNVAIELYIKEQRQKPEEVFPLISPVCPVVVRLIAHRFPSLLKHIPPLATPREIVAREAKVRLSSKYDCKEEDIKVLHITPCPSKMICIKEPILQEHSYLDAAIGINSIYEELSKNICDLDEDKVLYHSGGVGLGWGMSGGEISGLDLNCLAVSGLQETISYLGKIEMGLLDDIDYIEFRTCTEGCLAGPFTVVDKYRGKRRLQSLIQMFGVDKRVKYGYVKKLYENGWFFTRNPSFPLRERGVQLTTAQIYKGIERRNQVEKILQLLPGKECGACGSPDCETFAEDVVDGEDALQSCVFLEYQKNKMGVRGAL